MKNSTQVLFDHNDENVDDTMRNSQLTLRAVWQVVDRRDTHQLRQRKVVLHNLTTDFVEE